MTSLDSVQASLDSLKKTSANSNAKVDLLITLVGSLSATLGGLSGAGGASSSQLDDLRASIDSTVSSLNTEADKVTAALSAFGGTADTGDGGGTAVGDGSGSTGDAGASGDDTSGADAGTGTDTGSDTSTGADGTADAGPSA